MSLTSRTSRRKRDRSLSTSRDRRRESYSPPPVKKSRRTSKKDSASSKDRRKQYDEKLNSSSKNGRKRKRRTKSNSSQFRRWRSGISGGEMRLISDRRSSRGSDDSSRREVRNSSQSQTRRRVDSSRRVEIRSPNKLPYQQLSAGSRDNPLYPRLRQKNHHEPPYNSSEYAMRKGRDNFQGRRHSERRDPKMSHRLNNNRQFEKRTSRFTSRLSKLLPKQRRGLETNFNTKQRRGPPNHFSSKHKRVVNTFYRTKRVELEPPPPGLPSNMPSKPKLPSNRPQETTSVSSPQLTSKRAARSQDSKASHKVSKSDAGTSDVSKGSTQESESIFDTQLLRPEDKATRFRRILGPMLSLITEGVYGEKYNPIFRKYNLLPSKLPRKTSKHRVPKIGPREKRLNELLSLVAPISEPLVGGTLIWSKPKQVSCKASTETNSGLKIQQPYLAPLRPQIAMARPKTEVFEEEYKEEKYMIFPKPKPTPQMPPPTAPFRTVLKDDNFSNTAFARRYQDPRRLPRRPVTSTLDFI